MYYTCLFNTIPKNIKVMELSTTSEKKNKGMLVKLFMTICFDKHINR